MEIVQAEGVRIPAAGVFIEGDLQVPRQASGTLEEVCVLAAAWCATHLRKAGPS